MSPGARAPRSQRGPRTDRRGAAAVQGSRGSRAAGRRPGRTRRWRIVESLKDLMRVVRNPVWRSAAMIEAPRSGRAGPHRRSGRDRRDGARRRAAMGYARHWSARTLRLLGELKGATGSRRAGRGGRAARAVAGPARTGPSAGRPGRSSRARARRHRSRSRSAAPPSPPPGPRLRRRRDGRRRSRPSCWRWPGSRSATPRRSRRL